MTITAEEVENLARMWDRWEAGQAADALRSLAAERDHWEKTAMRAAQRHEAAMARADKLQAENARLREALKKIGSCHSYHPEDVVAVARAALGEKEQTND
jgi:hypothetical protein